MDRTRHSIDESLAPNALSGVLAREFPSALVEISEGLNAIDAKLRLLSAQTESEVTSFIAAGKVSKTRLRETQRADEAMYSRGVRSRSIYLSDLREYTSVLDHVRWLNDRGAAVRTLPDLPTQMIIFDKKVAVLPFQPKSGNISIIIYREPLVVKCLQELFELNWMSATPLGMVLDNEGGQLASEERALLEMLSLGWIDKEICVAMGNCERTTARRVADLMARLGAKTRFMAGVQAAKRNWI